MRWVVVIWSMGAGACLTLALINCVVWWKNRTDRANIAFSLLAIAVAVFFALELALMRAETPEQFGPIVRWLNVPVLVVISSPAPFVCLYFRAGRAWLGWGVVCVVTV